MKNSTLGLHCLVLATILVPAFSFAAEREVLPDTVIPMRYEVRLAPDAAALTYTGEETVRLDVRRATPTITLNAKDLVFDAVTFDGKPVKSITEDKDKAQVTFVLPATASAGQHSLHIRWHGEISATDTTGLFAMDYDSPAGRKRTLATNLEPAKLRTFLPSWDEPERKAVFSLTLDAPSSQMALANMPVAETKPLGNGLSRVRFNDTPKMSTYLFFFTIGDYERVHRTVAGVDLGVVVKRGDTDKAQYALDEAVRILPWYNDYFGTAYPLPKLDLIAAPGDITGAAMENWGANFYAQDQLLFDPATSTEGDRQMVFETVAHEMAHQWFGDLVTMQWWDDLWLNEGFARWMQTYVADALHPEWRTGLKALDIYERGKAADAKPSTHPVLQEINSPAQAEQAFDSITYDKGAAVINMLIAYAGDDALRDGIRAYMKTHAYGNTIDADLWSQVEKAAGKPVLQVETDFTRNAGLPLIRVTRTATGSRLAVDRFVIDPSQPEQVADWHLPVSVTTKSGAQALLLNGAADIADASPLVNAGAAAYTRVLYDDPTFHALSARLSSLPAADQANLLNDAAALGLSGYAPSSRIPGLMSGLPVSADPLVLKNAVSLVGRLDRIYSGSMERDAYRAWALKVLAPIAARAGDAPAAGEDSEITSLRSRLSVVLADLGDAATADRARALLASGGGSADERRAAQVIVAKNADAATFDAILATARAEADPLRRQQILTALAQARDPALTVRFVNEVALGPDAPAGTAAALLRVAIFTNPDAGWQALAPHFDDADFPIDPQTAARFIPIYASYSSDPKRIEDLQAYADRHLPADARQPVEGAKAQIRLNARIRTQALPDIIAWIAAH